MINNSEHIKNEAHRILKNYWGYDNFRGLQFDVINHICCRGDAIVLFPTGSGKSLCFQVPAIILPNVSIVITPLIALMEDQVQRLKSYGIAAESIHSGKSSRDVQRILDNCAYGSVKLLYLSPEKFNSESFLTRIREIKVSMIAVDEAHCISQWGFDFRPAYLQIAQSVNSFPNAVMVALTATATPAVVEDIKRYAGLRKPELFTASFKRENIALKVRKTENKYETLKNDLIVAPDQTKIVYVRSRNATRNIAEYLTGTGLSADYYHAGLSADRRQKVLENFLTGKTKVVCATNAFGMGLDKADVRSVIHFDIPPSLEEYVQEYGRAGRDGQPATATMIINRNDVNFLLKMHREKHLSEELITDIYVGLHKYYKIPTYAGEGLSFPLSVKKLSDYLRLTSKEIYYGLKLLEKNGFVNIYDHRKSQNKLTIRTDIQTIRSKSLEPKNQNVLLALVRMYEGILHGYCDINLSLISKHCELENTKDLMTILNDLKQRNLVDFTKLSPGERIVFLQDRIPRQGFGIDRKIYIQEHKNNQAKIDAILQYIDSETCRANFVLKYFGQEEEYECGICDVCKGENKADSSISTRRIQDMLEENSGKTPE